MLNKIDSVIYGIFKDIEHDGLKYHDIVRNECGEEGLQGYLDTLHALMEELDTCNTFEDLNEVYDECIRGTNMYVGEYDYNKGIYEAYLYVSQILESYI